MPKNYGTHLGFEDEDYKSQGVEIVDDEKVLVESAKIIVQLALPSDQKISLFKEDQILIGVLNPFLNKEKLSGLVKKKNK